MRLLNIYTLTHKEFEDYEVPYYAIASHRWLATSDEPTFQDFERGTERQKMGYMKILGFSRFMQHLNNMPGGGYDREHSLRATRRNIEWLWVDTSCINKYSSAELQEAITSMHKWYSHAYVCYAYLNDVHSVSDLARSQWFTRGWTLQELVAPPYVVFINANWEVIGHKNNGPFGLGPQLNQRLAGITGIPSEVLSDPLKLYSCPVNHRVKWLQGRRTKRPEDMAYCLSGILDVALLAMYGEGGFKAWYRLREEVWKWHNQLIDIPERLAAERSNRYMTYPPALQEDSGVIMQHQLFDEVERIAAGQLNKNMTQPQPLPPHLGGEWDYE